LGLIDEMKSNDIDPSNDHYDAAISVCADKGQWAKVVELLEKAKDQGIRPSLFTYNEVLRACEHGDECMKALDLLYNMQWDGI